MGVIRLGACFVLIAIAVVVAFPTAGTLGEKSTPDFLFQVAGPGKPQNTF